LTEPSKPFHNLDNRLLHKKKNAVSEALLFHADNAAQSLTIKHVLESLIDFREGDSVCYELLQLQFLTNPRKGTQIWCDYCGD